MTTADVLPPPHDLVLPIVKLFTHTTAYRDPILLPESLPLLCSSYVESTQATHASPHPGSTDCIKGADRMEAQDQNVL